MTWSEGGNWMTPNEKRGLLHKTSKELSVFVGIKGEAGKWERVEIRESAAVKKGYEQGGK